MYFILFHCYTGVAQVRCHRNVIYLLYIDGHVRCFTFMTLVQLIRYLLQEGCVSACVSLIDSLPESFLKLPEGLSRKMLMDLIEDVNGTTRNASVEEPDEGNKLLCLDAAGCEILKKLSYTLNANMDLTGKLANTQSIVTEDVSTETHFSGIDRTIQAESNSRKAVAIKGEESHIQSHSGHSRLLSVPQDGIDEVVLRHDIDTHLVGMRKESLETSLPGVPLNCGITMQTMRSEAEFSTPVTNISKERVNRVCPDNKNYDDRSKRSKDFVVN